MQIEEKSVDIMLEKAPAEVIYIKLGGGLLTDKTIPDSLHHKVLNRLVQEIAVYRSKNPEVHLVIGHGNGSFGHPVAELHKERLAGMPWDLEAAEAVRVKSAQLNQIVITAFATAGLKVTAVHPDAHLFERELKLEGHIDLIDEVLQAGGIPLVHGAMIDIHNVNDEVIGYRVLSTEGVLTHLAREHVGLKVRSALFMSSLSGILRTDNSLIKEVPAGQIGDILRTHPRVSVPGTQDVSGQMGGKAIHADLFRSVTQRPVVIASGLTPGLLLRALQGERVTGTWFV